MCLFHLPRFVFPLVLVVIAVLLNGCEKATSVTEDEPAKTSSGETATATSRDAIADDVPSQILIKPKDRLLFVGDDLTQQLFYPRATVNGLLSVMPRSGIRYFNGGRAGETAESAARWVDDLVDLTEPTFVFLCFGLNEANSDSSDEQVVKAYVDGMKTLITKLKKNKKIRAIYILTAPAVPAGAVSGEKPTGVNARLLKLAQAAVQLARSEKVGMIDLFDRMYGTYGSAHESNVALAYNDRLPAEHGHVVLASLLLKGLGVKPAQLEAVDWSPVKPLKMGSICPALAMPLRKPDPNGAEASYYLYELHRKYDTAFFRAWRLAGRGASRKSRAEAMRDVEAAWGDVYPYYIERYGR